MFFSAYDIIFILIMSFYAGFYFIFKNNIFNRDAMFQQLFEIKKGFVFELLFSKLGPIVVKKINL